MQKHHSYLALVLSLQFGLTVHTAALARHSSAPQADAVGTAATNVQTDVAWTVPPPTSDRPEDWLARVRRAASEGDIFSGRDRNLSRQEGNIRQEEFNRILSDTQTKLSGMGESIIPVLINGLADRNLRVRSCCVFALASFGKASAPALLQSFTANRDQRAAVVSVFARAGAPATEIIVDNLKTGNAHDKALSAQLLADLVTGGRPIYKSKTRMRGASDTIRLLPDSAQATMLAALDGPADAAVRCNLLKALTYFGAEDLQLRDKLCLLLSSDSDAAVRQEAANTLILVVADESPEAAGIALQALAKALKSDNDSTVRIAAAQAIKAAGPKAIKLIPNLREATHDHVDSVRQSALVALCGLAPADPKLFVDVLAALKESDFNTVHIALYTLSLLGPDGKDALPQVLDFARTNSGNTRWRAIIALRSMGPTVAPQAMPVLLECLRQTDEHGQSDIVQAIGAMGRGARPALPQLEGLAKTTDDTILKRTIKQVLDNLAKP